MSQSIPAGYIPPGNPQGLAQKTCPGDRHWTFKSRPRVGNSTRAGIVKNESETSKNFVDQIFTGENRKKVEFLTIFEVYMFSQWNFA